MKSVTPLVVTVTCFVLLCLCAMHVCSQMMPGMPGMGQQKRASPYKKYHPRIQCQVCEQMIKQIVRETKSVYESANKRVSEAELFNLTEATCNPFKDEGIWLTQYDIAKEPPKLKLKLMVKNKDEIGECDRECETIAYSCSEILDDNNIEIVEYLWGNLGQLKRSALVRDICPIYCKKEKSDVSKTSKMGKDKWVPLYDIEKRKMMQMSESMPPGVQMYDPSMMDMESMMEQMQMYGGDKGPEMGDFDPSDIEQQSAKQKKKPKKSAPMEGVQQPKDEKADEMSFVDYVGNGIDTVSNWFNWGSSDEDKKGDL